MQKSMSPPHSPQKQLKADKTTRATVQKSAPLAAQSPPYNHIKGLYTDEDHKKKKNINRM